MGLKIAHAADIHIRGLRYLDELKYTFERFEESLREHKPDLVFIGGDTYHSKLTPTHEYFDICRSFFKMLERVSPKTIIIPGNHDLALNNLNRVDAITPVIKSLDYGDEPSHDDQIYYSKHSEIWRYKSVKFYHLSCLDKKEDWPKPLEKDRHLIKIALYHGSIDGSTVDSGWVSRGNRDDISIFDGFDYGFLGDIHSHQFLTPSIAYPGSLRQNNFGEDIDKGYIMWDIRGKKDFDAEFIGLDQKRYFFTINVDSVKNLPLDLGLPEDSRIRIRPTNSFTPAEEIKVKDEIERAYKPSFCVVLPPGIDTSEFQATLSDGTVLDENVRDFETQKQLIREFFDDQGIESDTIDKVIDLDKKYHSYIDTNLLRNVTWNLKSFAWENLFSYGRGNKLDFDKLRGVIGVFGRNGVGKTSIFDAINYTLFSRINKDGANKNSQYVNNKCKNAAGKLVLSLSDKEWYVHRTTKNKKTKKGETKASNEVDFRIPKEGKQGNLNGETIVHTNKEIEKILGSLDDLNMISIVPQFGLTGLIDAKKTERKKTYAKFMDLGIFDQKFKLANEDFKEKKALVEEYNKTNFSKEIEDVDEKLKEISNEVRELQLNRTVGENSAEQTAEEILEVKSRIRLIDLEPKEQENPEDVKSEIVRLNEGIAKLNSLIKLRNLGVKTLEEAVGSINIEAAQGRLDSDDESLRQLDKINSSVAQCRKRGQILGTIPGVSACKKCPLVKDAYDSESQIPILENESERLSGRLLTPIEKLELQRAIDSIRELKEERSKLKNLELRLKNATMELGNAEKRLQSIEDKAEAIKKNKELTDYLAELKKDEDLIKHVLKTTNDKLISLTKDQGRLEERKDNLEAKMKEAEKARDEYYIYQLYLSAMGKDGIAYMIMSKKIPIVAKEVNHILSQVSDFRFVIENDEKEKSINYYILSKDGKTTAELAGGAQKTIASIALRAALWKISSLPKPNFLILDEPFGCIDSASYDLMLRFLGYLKNYYDHIFIISHKDELKTSMDSTIHVKRNKKGYSYVEQ